MKNLSTKLLVTLFALLSTFGLKAQNQVKQIIIGSGGLFGNPGNMVTFGTYDPATANYAVFDSIPGNYTNDAVIDGDYLYINADTTLYKYDLNTYQQVDSLKLNGMNRMAVADSILIISTSYGASSGPYVHFYNKNTLAPIAFADNKADMFAEDISVAGNKAYVALVGTWPDYTDSGTVVEFDLANKTSEKIIFDDTIARVINSVYPYQNKLHAVASVHGIIGIYNTINNSFTYEPSAASMRGFGTDQNLLWVQTYSGARAFNMLTGQFHPSYFVQQAFERGTLDTMNNTMYLSQTDFFSYGRVIVSNYSGQVSDTFDVGIAPQALAVHYSSPTSVKNTQKQPLMALFPNPATETITISSGENLKKATIYDVTGKTLLNYDLTGQKQQAINISELAKGIYFLQAISAEGAVSTRKFIKE